VGGVSANCEVLSSNLSTPPPNTHTKKSSGSIQDQSGQHSKTLSPNKTKQNKTKQKKPHNRTKLITCFNFLIEPDNMDGNYTVLLI
jgi:hypothetical protein